MCDQDPETDRGHSDARTNDPAWRDQCGAEETEQLCREILERQWRQAGTPEFSTAEEILKEYPQLRSRSEQLVDIVYNEFLVRKESASGQLSDPNHYLRRFPDIAEPLSRQFRLYACLADELPEASEPASEKDRDDPESLADSLIGSTIRQRYHIIESIGDGGAAVVFRATDVQLKRDVAFKIARTPLRRESRLFCRFLREAESAARLSHPGIVQVFEFGEYHERPFIVGQLVTAGTLAARIETVPADMNRACEWLIAVCDAVDYAHQCGVIHRDLKPANILLDENSRPLITDFGLAAITQSDSTLTEHGDVLGTPAYMSPEQASGQSEPGPSCDVYSLGVTLYHVLTASLPFSGSPAVVLHRILTQEPTPPRSKNPAVPLDLQTICLKAMSRRPADRYLTVHDMAEDLRRFCRLEPILARPVGTVEKLIRQARRHPIVSVLCLVLLLFAGIVLGGALQYRDVVAERNRATAAEKKTQELLAVEAAFAGQLARRQGKTSIAVRHFQEAIDRGITSAGTVHLRMAECELVNGSPADAVIQVRNSLRVGLPPAEKGALDLVKAQLALLGQLEFGVADTLLHQIALESLSEPDRQFVRGLLAGSSPVALTQFQQAIELDSYHHGARRMAGILALSLAKLKFAIEVADVSLQLFPEDPDFAIIAALACAAQGNLQKAHSYLARTGLPETERQRWGNLAVFLHKVCHDLTSGGERVFYKALTAEEAELSFEKLVRLLVEFRRDYLPLLRSRRWYLPPATERCFSDFIDSAVSRTPAKGLVSGLTIGVDETRILERSLILVEAHPEATLGTVIARRLLDSGATDQDTRIRIQFFYEQALISEGFISDVHDHALLGAFSVAVHLDRVDHYEPEKNRSRAYELLAKMAPSSISQLKTARILALLPMQDARWHLSDRFMPRWTELARSHGSDQELTEALWHQALVQRSQEKWLEVLQNCDEMIRINPATGIHPGAIQPEALRGQAAAELRKALAGPRDTAE